jgi:hypothetical protein
MQVEVHGIALSAVTRTCFEHRISLERYYSAPWRAPLLVHSTRPIVDASQANPVCAAAGPPDDAARNQRRGARQACSRSTLRAAAIVCAARQPVHELRLFEMIAALHDDVMDRAPFVIGLDGFQADEGAPRWLEANKGFAAAAPAGKWVWKPASALYPPARSPPADYRQRPWSAFWVSRRPGRQHTPPARGIAGGRSPVLSGLLRALDARWPGRRRCRRGTRHAIRKP